jgi:hypothetical protein
MQNMTCFRLKDPIPLGVEILHFRIGLDGQTSPVSLQFWQAFQS